MSPSTVMLLEKLKRWELTVQTALPRRERDGRDERALRSA